MGKLFDNLPRRFFNPLAAMSGGESLQQFYAECLLLINSLFADRTQVSRDDLKDEIINLLLADHIQSIDTAENEDQAGKTMFSPGSRLSDNEPGQSREERMANHDLQQDLYVHGAGDDAGGLYPAGIRPEAR